MEILNWCVWILGGCFGVMVAVVAGIWISSRMAARRFRNRCLGILAPALGRAGLELIEFDGWGYQSLSRLVFRRSGSADAGCVLTVTINLDYRDVGAHCVAAYLGPRRRTTPDFTVPIPCPAALDDALRSLANWLGELNPTSLARNS